MKDTNYFFDIIKEIIIKFLSCGLDKKQRGSLSPEKVLSLQGLTAFSLISIVFIVTVYIFYFFHRPDYIAFVDTLCSSLFLLTYLSLIIYLRVTKNDALGRSVIVVSLFILFYASVLFLDEEGAIYIFISLIPYIVIYIKGSRQGLYWLMAFFAVYLLIFILSRFHVIATKFPSLSLDNIIIGFILLSVFAFFSTFRIEQNIEAIKLQLDEITKISKIDSLTKIMNKRAFMEVLEKERQRIMRRSWWLEGSPVNITDGIIGRQAYHHAVNQIRDRFGTLAVIIIDVDFFKIFNDSYGHLFGDYILKSIGEVFLSGEFFRDNDVSGRFGGEEFIILLPETSSESAYSVAERLREKIVNMRFPFQDHSDISITLSLGISEMRFTDLDSSEIIKRADIALYRAKESGRNRTVIYNDSMA